MEHAGKSQVSGQMYLGAPGEMVTVAVRAGDGIVRVEVTDRAGPGVSAGGWRRSDLLGGERGWSSNARALPPSVVRKGVEPASAGRRQAQVR